MSWIDDLQVRVDQAKKWTSEAKKDVAQYADVSSYIGSVITDATVKSGAAASGNLSQKELDAGIRGNTGAVPDSSQADTPGIMNSNPGSMIVETLKKNMVLVGLGAAGAVYFFMKKGR